MRTKSPFDIPASNVDFIQSLGFLMEGASTMVGIKDLDCRYVFVNRELETRFGAAPGAMIGKTVEDWVDPENAHAMLGRDAEVISSGKPTRFIEQFSTGKNLISCATIRFPYRDQAGVITGVAFIAIDILSRNDDVASINLALENAKNTIDELQTVVQEMRIQAMTDPLTGALNRSQIEDKAQQEIARLHRYGHPVSLVFIDLDYFKRINDTWGHITGDEVLKGFADVMTSTMRATDFLGRWGGEEFILLLPNTGRLSARLVAERARTAQERHIFTRVGQVTASFGVSTCLPGESLKQWMARADEALYRAKENGRNCVETDADGGAAGADDVEERITPSFVGLTWRKAYECGNQLIDRQHRGLFESANQLLGAVLGGQPKDEITLMINALLAEVVQHFEDEETIFKAAGFPEAEQHHEIHQQLVASAVRLAQRYESDKLELGELFAFLAHEVIAKHMLSDDRKFFPYVGASSS